MACWFVFPVFFFATGVFALVLRDCVAMGGSSLYDVGLTARW
jgi:hypothetical protein